jgi:Tfp pilus assembly protein PilN
VRFDYLHSARAVMLQRMLEIRVPERFHGALFAVGAAVAVIAGAWCIEAYRLREALKVQAVYEQRYDEMQARLKQANVYYDRVRAIVALDRHVRQIAVSGDTDARTLAEIANRLPQHAWLTGISHDGSGMALQGHAKDLSVLSGVMRGLMRAKQLRSPTLVTASSEKQQGQDAGLKYEIHVDGAAQ